MITFYIEAYKDIYSTMVLFNDNDMLQDDVWVNTFDYISLYPVRDNLTSKKMLEKIKRFLDKRA